jgi:hypothetical protein
MARIRPSLRPTETYTESNFLRVHTFAKRRTESVRLVTIEHLCYRPQIGPDGAPRGASGWVCETIVDGEAMSREDALFIAKSYAARNDVPVIYECHSD